MISFETIRGEFNCIDRGYSRITHDQDERFQIIIRPTGRDELGHLTFRERNDWNIVIASNWWFQRFRWVLSDPLSRNGEFEEAF